MTEVVEGGMMAVLAKICAIIIPKRIRLVEVEVTNQDNERKLLDERLEKIIEATLNGESEWFLERESND